VGNEEINGFIWMQGQFNLSKVSAECAKFSVYSKEEFVKIRF
jgi:hypothetical protein